MVVDRVTLSGLNVNLVRGKDGNHFAD